MAERIQVEKGSLAESMLTPLYAKAQCAQRFGDLFPDDEAVEIMARVGDAFRGPHLKDLDLLPGALRSRIFTDQITDYLAHNKDACVVDLDAGYDTFFPAVDNGTCTWVNIDRQETLDARRSLMSPHDRETNLAFSIFDPDWFNPVKKIAGGHSILFIANDVFSAFKPEAVRLLVCSLADEFPGAVLCFDTVSKSNQNRANKAARKAGTSEIRFALDDVSALRAWSKNIIDAQDISAAPGDIMASKALSLPARLMLFSGGSAGVTKIARLQFARR